MKSNKIILIVIYVIGILFILLGIVKIVLAFNNKTITDIFNKMIGREEEVIDGGVTEKWLDGYSEVIKSKEIESFEYTNGDFSVKCEKDGKELKVLSSGVDNNGKTKFDLDYKTTDDKFLSDLQDIVDKYNLSKGNGYFYEVGGLPPGLGDKLLIKYDTKEAIYKESNQSNILSEEVINSIYNLFNELAIKNGYDFTKDKSNNIKEDLVTVDFLQGTWKGTHFGDNIIVKFSDKTIYIFINDKLVETSEYNIVNGSVRKNELVDNPNNTKNEYSYKEFDNISSFKKKNDFLLTAYFNKDSYSTTELMKEE